MHNETTYTLAQLKRVLCRAYGWDGHVGGFCPSCCDMFWDPLVKHLGVSEGITKDMVLGGGGGC